MTAKRIIRGLVADLISGSDLKSLQSAWHRLGTCGQQGVNAILDAMEGKSGPAPKDRHPIDVHDDLAAGLHAVAQLNPESLIAAISRRPEHTFSLICALGSSRDKAAVDVFIEYARHKDPWIRWAAVSGLARLRRKFALQPLLDALRDRSDMVRFTALEGVARVADRRAIEPLKRYLAHKRLQPGGRRIASELLNKLEQS